MQPSSFWQKVYLGDYANNCIWHMLIPTTMAGHILPWSEIEHLIDKNDKIAVDAHKANRCCGICNESQEDVDYVFAVRVLIGKRPEEKYWTYSISVGTAIICFDCVYERRKWLRVGLISNSDMQNFVLDTLQSISYSFGMKSEELSGEQIWDQMMAQFNMRHEEVMKRIGKMDSSCLYCEAKKPKNRCSACHFARYCNTDCSKADWARHKVECGRFQKTPIFSNGKESYINLLK